MYRVRRLVWLTESGRRRSLRSEGARAEVELARNRRGCPIGRRDGHDGITTSDAFLRRDTRIGPGVRRLARRAQPNRPRGHPAERRPLHARGPRGALPPVGPRARRGASPERDARTRRERAAGVLHAGGVRDFTETLDVEPSLSEYPFTIRAFSDGYVTRVIDGDRRVLVTTDSDGPRGTPSREPCERRGRAVSRRRCLRDVRRRRAADALGIGRLLRRSPFRHCEPSRGV